MAEPSLSSSLLRNLGLTGTGIAASSLLPPSTNPQVSDTRVQREFGEAGAVADPDLWGNYNRAVSRPQTFEAQLKLWGEMADYDLISAALSEIVEECCQTDDNSPASIWYECNDTDVEDDLNEMLQAVNAESFLPSQVWHVAGFGNHFEKLDYSVGEGVTGMSFVHPLEMRRYWLERNRRCIGFRRLGKPCDHSDAFVLPDGTNIPRVGMATNQHTVEDLWYPWDFLHFRRMYRHRQSEHGEALFDDAQGIYKRLRMALDQMVVFRQQIQPDRYTVNIDTQEQSPRDQMNTVQRWKQSLRSSLSFGSGQAGQDEEFKAIYKAMALDTILWVARPKGFQHSIEKLAGTSTVPDIYDIELLQNLLFAVMGMPKWWVMGQKDGGNPPSGKALLATDMRFLRKVKGIRKPILAGYQWLAYFHALLKKKDVSTLEIKAKMTPIGGLEDQAKLDVLTGQVGLLNGMGDLMQRFNLPREAWIEIIFKRYLHLPEEIVNSFLVSLPPEAGQDQGGGQGAPMESETVRRMAGSRTSPSTAKILVEVDRQLGGKPETARALRQIREALDGKPRKENYTFYKTPDAILSLQNKTLQVEARDYVRSSYQNDERPLKIVTESPSAGAQERTFLKEDQSAPAAAPAAPAPVSTASVTPSAAAPVEAPYRRFMKL